jgi:translation initiation factor IF-2
MNVANLTFAAAAAVFFSATAWSQEPDAPPMDGAPPAALPAPAPNPAADTPYAGIVARNMFGLVPIPPPVPVDQPQVDPPSKITVTGIMSIFGRDQAIFTTAGDKPKGGQPPKEGSYVLAEGERQDDIEVVKINREVGLVSFKNHGIPQEIPLLAAKDAGGPPGGGGGPGKGGGGPGRSLAPSRGGGPGLAQSGTRQIGAGGGLNPAASALANNAGGAGGIGNQSRSQNPGEQMTVDQQELLIEAQRKVFQDQGDGTANILPPTRGAAKSIIDAASGGSGNGPPGP